MLASDPVVHEFVVRWEATGGRSYLASGHDDLLRACQGALSDVIQKQSSRLASYTVVYWNSPDVPNLDWPSIKTDKATVNWIPWTSTGEMRQITAGSFLGITGCAWAVSSTGSVALYSTPKTGLLPSVLTPYHLIFVPREKIVATVAEGLQHVPRDPLPPLVKIITGPSMTADIEGILVTGVHGPGQVIAVIYEL